MGIKLIINDIQELYNYEHFTEVEFIGFTLCLKCKYKELNVFMRLPEFYPLLPPSNIKINNSNILDNISYNTGNNEMIEKYFKINNLKEESILNNWKSNLKIIDIIHEFELYKLIVASSYVFHHFEKNNILNNDILKYISLYIK